MTLKAPCWHRYPVSTLGLRCALGMGPSGLPNRAPTGGWGTARTVRATACRLGGGGGRVVGKRPLYALGSGAPPLVGWSGRGMASPATSRIPARWGTIPGAVGRSSPVVRSRGQKKEGSMTPSTVHLYDFAEQRHRLQQHARPQVLAHLMALSLSVRVGGGGSSV